MSRLVLTMPILASFTAYLPDGREIKFTYVERLQWRSGDGNQSNQIKVAIDAPKDIRIVRDNARRTT